MNAKKLRGFTLVEVLIVVVIMAILAATIIPQFTNATKDAQESTVLFNLQTLRSQIQMYRTQHNGDVPDALLAKLTSATNAAGAVGTGTGYPYGPYLGVVPENPITGSNAVKAITSSPAKLVDVTTDGAGWMYNATTGEIWIDDETLYVN